MQNQTHGVLPRALWLLVSSEQKKYQSNKAQSTCFKLDWPTSQLYVGLGILFSFLEERKEGGKKIRKTSPKQYSVLVPADLFRILSLPLLDQERLVCTKNSTPPMVRWDPLPLFTEITHETASAFPRFLS